MYWEIIVKTNFDFTSSLQSFCFRTRCSTNTLQFCSKNWKLAFVLFSIVKFNVFDWWLKNWDRLLLIGRLITASRCLHFGQSDTIVFILDASKICHISCSRYKKSRYYGDINTPNIILIFCLFTLVPAPKRKNSSIMFHPCYYFWQCVTICAFTLIYCTSKKTNIILINREYTRNHVSKFIFFIKNQEFENHYPIKHRHKIHIHSLTEIRNIICYTALIWAKSRDTLRFNEKLSSRVSASLFNTELYG